MPRSTNIPENARDGDAAVGLYKKYNVVRTDGSSFPGQKHSNCDYFVLDLAHDEFARDALRAYAMACHEKFPLLSQDLKKKLERM